MTQRTRAFLPQKKTAAFDRGLYSDIIPASRGWAN
jgi:hypothetical protein